ncbi:hypothetical protein [Streptomyces sp. NPDC056323]|uniref:hypothetical protein n=1 Tax=Streptomyces sp. NPDC056323 TaxID=3345784 RepID=UPI0035E1AC1E
MADVAATLVPADDPLLDGPPEQVNQLSSGPGRPPTDQGQQILAVLDMGQRQDGQNVCARPGDIGFDHRVHVRDEVEFLG